jgi:hypothetical protein
MDCDDGDIEIRPGAAENCTDGVDNNCNSLVDAKDPNAVGCPVAECTDMDGDDYSVEGGQCGPVDCDDANPDINPGAIEICDDGFDNNCDANADAVDPTCEAVLSGEDVKVRDRHERAKRGHFDRHQEGHRNGAKPDDDDDDHDDDDRHGDRERSMKHREYESGERD